MEKENKSFSHDSNAMNDPKCMLLVEQFGMEGYGAFWGLLEMLSAQPDYSLPIILIPSIAKRFSMSESKIKTIIENYGLFVITEKSFFYSQSLSNTMRLTDDKREKRRLAGKKGGEVKALNMRCDKSDNKEDCSKTVAMIEQCYSNATVLLQKEVENAQLSDNEEDCSKSIAMIEQCYSNATVLLQNVDNKDIENEKCENFQQNEKSPHIYINNINNKDKYKNVYMCNSEKKKSTAAANFFPPSVEEVRVYCNERKNNIDPEKFIDFYSSKGWMIGRNKMKDWKASVRTWEKQDKDNSTYQNKNSNETENSRYSKL